MRIIVALATGTLVGLVVGGMLLRRAAADRADGLFRAWRAEEAGALSRAAADDGRLAGKTSIGEAIDGLAPLPFLASDAHFVGHPVHLVVFDGDSEVKAGVVEELRGIALVNVLDPGGGTASWRDHNLVAECLAGGRVRWETLRL